MLKAEGGAQDAKDRRREGDRGPLHVTRPLPASGPPTCMPAATPRPPGPGLQHPALGAGAQEARPGAHRQHRQARQCRQAAHGLHRVRRRGL